MNHFDVLIIGAGLSGVGAAVHLTQRCPGKTYAILEAREAMGGTWDLFRYPGIRSDSDMHTLGYSFKPWTEAKAIADGPSIRKYVNQTARQYGVDTHIRYGRRMTSADWDSAASRWTVQASGPDGAVESFTCGLLYMCSGYYSYRGGYLPDFPGWADYQGVKVHPQSWPEELDYAGKRVLIIGSGATAMTLVPAMAKGGAGHVTMLQRSPTYVVSRPDKDGVANALRRVLPDSWAYALTRWKNTTLQGFFYRRTRTRPAQTREMLLSAVSKALPDYDVKTHFTPRYDPWDQRLCLIPNGDLFDAIKSGQASVETDEIDAFTAGGVKLKSGKTIDADIVVTATGLQLVVLGEATFSVDGRPVDFGKTWSYKGMMYSDVPNLISTFGYINASWTLRADLIAEFVCRLVQHMDATSTTQVTPRLRAGEEAMPARDWIEGFSANYMRRDMHRFPKQGDRDPWLNSQDFAAERKMIRHGAIDDGVLTFTAASGTPAETAAVLQAAE